MNYSMRIFKKSLLVLLAIALVGCQTFIEPELIAQETHSKARLQALLTHAELVGQRPADARLAADFDRVGVPSLLDAGLRDSESETQLAAVLALERAATPRALAALEALAHSEDPLIARMASHESD